MIYWIKEGRLRAESPEEDQREAGACWGVFPMEETERIRGRFGIPDGFMRAIAGSRSTRFESHDGFDFLCVNTRPGGKTPPRRTYIYLSQNRLFFFCEDPAKVRALAEGIAGDREIDFERLLYVFLESVTEGDGPMLETLEQRISEMEEAVITSRRKNYVADIIAFRRRLMGFKRHYEQLLDVLDAIEENENGLIDRRTLRYLKIYGGRVNRLYHNVMNMRDYVTQVREAYQAEVDISLNNIMKLFTVITAIFLPLTLIVGWYGMNLQMPEYGWKYGYPAVIGLSAASLAVCLWLLRKNRWFR